MKFLFGILLTLVFGFIAHQFFPWWVIPIIGFIVGGFLNLSGWKSFFYAFLGVALLWGMVALFQNFSNGGILLAKISALFGDLHGSLILLFTAIVGGLLGGLGAATGSLGRQLLSSSS